MCLRATARAEGKALSTSQCFLKESIVSGKPIGLLVGHDARYKLRGAMAFHEAQGTAKNSIATVAKLFLPASALVKVRLMIPSPSVCMMLKPYVKRRCMSAAIVSSLA